MDERFRKTNFVTADDDDYNSAIDFLHSYPSEKCTIEEFKKILKSIKELMSDPTRWPTGTSTNGEYIVNHFIGAFESALEDEHFEKLETELWDASVTSLQHPPSGFSIEISEKLLKKLQPSFYQKPANVDKVVDLAFTAKLHSLNDAKSGDEKSDIQHLNDGVQQIIVRCLLDNFDEQHLNRIDLCRQLLLHGLERTATGDGSGAKLISEILSFFERQMNADVLKASSTDVDFLQKLAQRLHTVVPTVTDKLGKKYLNDLMRSLHVAVRDNKSTVNYSPMIDDIIALGFVCWKNSLHLDVAYYMMTAANETLTVHQSLSLKDAPSIVSFVENPEQYEFVFTGQAETDREEDKKDRKRSRSCLLSYLVPGFSKTAEELARAMECYYRLLDISTKEFKETFDRAFFRDCFVVIKKNAVKIKPTITKMIQTLGDYIIGCDSKLQGRELGNPSINEDMDNAQRILTEMLNDIFKSPGRKAIESDEVQEGLFEYLEKVIRKPSICGIDTIASIDDVFKAAFTAKRLPVILELWLLLAQTEIIEAEHIGIAIRTSAVLQEAFKQASNNSKTILNNIDALEQLLTYCADQDFEITTMDGRETMSIHGFTVMTLMSPCLNKSDDDIIEVNKRLYPQYIKAVRKSWETENLTSLCHQLTSSLSSGQRNVESMLPHMEEYLQLLTDMRDKQRTMFDGVANSFLGQMSLLTNKTLLQEKSDMCTEVATALAGRMQQLIDLFNEPSSEMTLIMTIAYVSQHTPEVANDVGVAFLLNAMLNGNAANGNIGASALAAMSEKRGELLRPHVGKIVQFAKKSPEWISHINDMLRNSGMEPKDLVQQLADLTDFYVASSATLNHATNAASCCLKYMREAGVEHPELLAERKEQIEKWRENSALLDVCNHLLDVIANRSLAGIETTVTNQGEKVNELDKTVTDTTKKVSKIDEKVEDTRKDVTEVKVAVAATGERVDQLEGTVADMDDRINEIDLKTLTAAPAWSREVSRLLNPESETDWRLLAQRLNYSADDVRAWATTPDPCMSLLAEFFTNHRAAEAAKAVLTQLKEMNRLDAAAIVEGAILNAESSASDDPVEFTAPRNVFLSYQWGHQQEVKMLKQHLEKAGYRCWMDIGQMGGGDKLFSAIDAGIRSAKVVIACVTGKYSQSDNCRRELNLSVSLNKLLIPLQLEKVNWPPEGAMGPLLTEYLYIRMYDRSGKNDKPKDQPFWPRDKFDELLMQIRLAVAPDYDSVAADYADWWAPPDQEEVIVLPDRAGQEQQQKQLPPAADGESTQSPQIFLSYQWGKQPEVKALFGRLSSLGFSCWMDIFQMGGGDSLYEKIDRGVRGCRIVVALVTPKYSLSPNCRREVSLADATKKPILPVMLEKMPWPPEGPMAMVFTQLLYVQMYKEEADQKLWRSDKFGEILDRVRQLCQPVSIPAAVPAAAPAAAPAAEEKPADAVPAEARPISAKRKEKMQKVQDAASKSKTCSVL